jgi:hypothetical protein
VQQLCACLEPSGSRQLRRAQLEERRLGNEHYRAGRPAAALRHYERARGIVELVRGLAPADQAEVDRNRVAVALNAAAAHLALHQYADAVRLWRSGRLACSPALRMRVRDKQARMLTATWGGL